MTERQSSSRFRKGHSGNPKSRPRKTRPACVAPSPLRILVGESVSHDQGQGALSIEEALMLKTLEQAFAGKRPAIRKIIALIAERERARSKRMPRRRWRSRSVAPVTSEIDSSNADEAMKALGPVRVENRPVTHADHSAKPHLVLETWVTQAALSRRRWHEPFTRGEIEEIERVTHAPKDLRWPRGARHGR